MEGMTTCHKCKKKIRGKMVYAGGCVWHPSCYPYPKQLKKSPKGTKKRAARKSRNRA